MFESNFVNNDNNNEEYPDYFINWDKSVKKGITPGYFEIEEICDIIDIYLSEEKMDNVKFAIEYAFKLYPDNDDLVYEILLLLNDYELWNDLLTLSEKFKETKLVWADGHKITALLHLGMEEDAFHYFRKMKKKYAHNKKDLSIVYQAMGEALYEVDLYDAAIDVMKEAIDVVGADIDCYWLQLQSHLALDNKENVEELCSVIQKMNPMDAETWNKLGIIYKEIGNIQKEIEAFEFAYSLGYKDSQFILEMVYAYENNGNLNKALEKAEEYLSLYPDSYLLNIIAANLCSQTENWPKALQFIESAILLEPEMESLYLYKCEFLLKSGEVKKAIIALKEGITKTTDQAGDLARQLRELLEQYPDY